MSEKRKDNKGRILKTGESQRKAMKKCKKLYPDKPLPHITPHVFRHTFRTNMANAGMDIKTLQCVMGHSDVGLLKFYRTRIKCIIIENIRKIRLFRSCA